MFTKKILAKDNRSKAFRIAKFKGGRIPASGEVILARVSQYFKGMEQTRKCEPYVFNLVHHFSLHLHSRHL